VSASALRYNYPPLRMPPVEIESESPIAPVTRHALVFRFDDFAYAPALRALFAVDRAFDDLAFYIAPSKDVLALDLFERLPEVGLPDAVHKPAWAAFEAVLRFLMQDPRLLTFVRGEARHGPVSFGYHASEPYARVEAVIAERIPVLTLAALRDAAESAARPMSEHDSFGHVFATLTLANVSALDELSAWARGERPWSPAWDALEGVAPALASAIARHRSAYNAVDHRCAAALARPANVGAWVDSLPLSPLHDGFTPVLAAVRAEGTLTDDLLLAAVVARKGGRYLGPAWWWAVGQLGDPARFASILRESPRPYDLVDAMVAMVKPAVGLLPIAIERAREVGSTDPSWRAIVRNGL
jgi:hypothetical protein